MPGYKFGNSENFSYQVPPGDYRWQVIGVEFGIQRGSGVTNGSDNMDVKLAFYKDGKKDAQWTETMIFHESIFWRLDTFLKSGNYKVGADGRYDPNGRVPKEGEELNFEADDIMGLQGWATVEDNKYKGKDGAERVNSRVARWLDKEKLPKAQVEKKVSLPDTGDWV